MSETPRKIQLFPRSRISPTALLGQTLERSNELKAVVIVEMDHEEHCTATWSAMTTAELVFMERVLSINIAKRLAEA